MFYSKMRQKCIILRVTSQRCPSHGQYKDPEFSAAGLWLVFNLKAIKIYVWSRLMTG